MHLSVHAHLQSTFYRNVQRQELRILASSKRQCSDALASRCERALTRTDSPGLSSPVHSATCLTGTQGICRVKKQIEKYLQTKHLFRLQIFEWKRFILN